MPTPESRTHTGGEHPTLLEVRELKKHFPVTAGFLRRQVGEVKAVDEVSFSVREGETLGLVGESGCGKTTLSRLIMRAYEPTGGSMRFRRSDGQVSDLATASEGEVRTLRREIQMVFQNPYASLNPRMTVHDVVAEPLVCNGWIDRRKVRERVAELLERCGLNPAYMSRYPHAFSGGQRQRIGIARSLALHPRLVLADEPVSALDVSVQAQILNLLKSLQRDFGFTYLFIAHDLGVVEHVSDRVMVMYVGKIVEMGSNTDVFRRPRHPYTEALLSAVPRPDPERISKRVSLQGEVADPANRPPGCPFHPRCRYAKSLCKEQEPPLMELRGEGGAPHLAACHFADQLELEGVGHRASRDG